MTRAVAKASRGESWLYGYNTGAFEALAWVCVAARQNIHSTSYGISCSVTEMIWRNATLAFLSTGFVSHY